jgi:hypothetical protein|tara:strand:+ start:1001 stop:1870 length:870 start_codon:yes stop_codon:yes gene_type:complete
MQQQVDNASLNEVNIGALEDNVTEEAVSDDFFADLDRSVNSGILEEADTSVSSASGDNKPQSVQGEVQTQGQEQVETLKQRYADSSKEGKRLSGKLNELEPYVPIINAMKDDPNLVAHVRNYFEGGGQTPKNMKEQLKLDEDFVFDPDDAVSDPASDSAKVLQSTIDGVVQRRLSDTLGKQKAENQRLSQESDFRQRYEMNEDEWSDFRDFAKQKTLTLDDIYYLKNRESRETNIAKDASTQVAQQMRNVNERPQSLATSGSQQVESSQENQLFDSILGIDKDLESAFG